MLANFLSKSKPINFIVLFSIFFCLFIYTVYNTFFLKSFYFEDFTKSLGFFVFFILIFFFYNFVVAKNKLTFDHSYANFFFTIFITYFLSIALTFKTLIFFLIYILYLRKIYSLRSKKRVIQKLFDSGFWLSILFIIEPFTILFSVLTYASIFLHQKITIHTITSPIIGFLAPIILYFSYCFWYDNSYSFVELFLFSEFKSFAFYSENELFWVSILILIFSLIAILLKSQKALSVNNSFKKSWILLIVNFVIAFSYAILIPIKSGAELLLTLFPSSVIIANGFEVINSNLIKNILLYFLLLSALSFPIFFIL